MTSGKNLHVQIQGYVLGVQRLPPNFKNILSIFYRVNVISAVSEFLSMKSRPFLVE